MKPAPFAYLPAKSAADAVRALSAHADSARLLAGGQSLVPMMNFRIARPEVLIDLNPCSDLAYVRREGPILAIGAMTRQFACERHPLVEACCPLLRLCLADAGPQAVRNRGTIGGMLANCYASADLVAGMLCLDAQIVAMSSRGTRAIAAPDFFLGAFTTALEADELLVEARIECKGRHRYAYRKLSDHRGGGAVAGVAMAAEVHPEADAFRLQDARVAALGLDSIAMRLPAVERALQSSIGQDITSSLAEDVQQRGLDAHDRETRARLVAIAALIEQALRDLREATRTAA